MKKVYRHPFDVFYAFCKFSDDAFDLNEGDYLLCKIKGTDDVRRINRFRRESGRYYGRTNNSQEYELAYIITGRSDGMCLCEVFKEAIKLNKT